MDDIQIAETVKKLQQDMLTNQEVIHFLTKLNHLELRVKNVAIMKLQKHQQLNNSSNVKDMLAGLIKVASTSSAKKKNLSRMSTNLSQLAPDGLVARLTDKIGETQRKF